ncbi:CSL zinc finger-domain-containing protein [Aspergillus floccosus]
MASLHDFYQILNLPFSASTTSGFTKQQLKVAYHRALLNHHPDKASTVTPTTDTSSTTPTSLPTDRPHRTQPDSTPRPVYTIDQITTAYKTLSDPQLRADYDRALRLDRSTAAAREKNATVFHTGLEVVDLEDLECDEEAACWYRGCRCGDERGFCIEESDLEREAEHGEIVVGCRGCSLWMKVLFAVAEDT